MTNSPSVEHTQDEQHTAEVSKVITMDSKVTFEVTNSNIWLNHLATTTIIQVQSLPKLDEVAEIGKTPSVITASQPFPGLWNECTGELRTAAEGDLAILTLQRHVGVRNGKARGRDWSESVARSCCSGASAVTGALTALVSQISSMEKSCRKLFKHRYILRLSAATNGQEDASFAAGRDRSCGVFPRGVSGAKYLERFGGYARQQELVMLQFQVMSIFDHLLVDPRRSRF